MKKNLGMTDKIIRGTIAAIIVVMYFADIISGTVAIVFGSIAAILFITSLISFCPMYSIFGHSSSRYNKSKT
ncbi:DUF2892 domain-containing protein [uncultured Flavobacterium sp.]|uniref:YgaP family membrane protein n=1 Tax=uncultured Flavobacterium sp. TaxID=165435 RepID=UPI0030EB285F|tara:strand:+ start:963 stop:1178 length:216 start_codon:yes stop_codon:yes gene_type:complete